MNNYLAFLSTPIALILYLQLTRTLAISVNDDSLEKMKIAPEILPTFPETLSTLTNEKPKYIQVSQVEQILLSIKEMFGKLKEQQRADATNISKMNTQLQLLALRLEDIEFQIGRMEQTGKSELAENNDLEKELQFEELKHRAEKNLQTTTTRMNDIEKLLKNTRTAQEVLLREVRKQGAFQIQLMTGMNVLKRNLESDWSEAKQNKSRNLQRFSEDTKIKISIQTIEEEIKSIQYLMSGYIRSAEENDQEIKLDLTNIINSFEESITNEIRKLNTMSVHQLKNIDKLLRGHDTLKRNYFTIQRFEESLEQKVMTVFEKLFDKIDYKTKSVHCELNRLLKNDVKLNGNKRTEKQNRSAKYRGEDYIQNECKEFLNEELNAEDEIEPDLSVEIYTEEAQLPDTKRAENITSNSTEATSNVLEQMQDDNSEKSEVLEVIEQKIPDQ